MVYFVNFLILGDHTNPVIEQIGQGVNHVVAGSDPWTIETGWRYMFGSEAVPAGIFALLICLVPESPRYLVMSSREFHALHVLARINCSVWGRKVLADIKANVTVKSELFPNTIRDVAVVFHWIFNFVVSSTFVPMFNRHLTEGDHFGHWFTYGPICIVAAIFVRRLVSETKGKTLEEMNSVWRK